jgi:hypothetical protein
MYRDNLEALRQRSHELDRELAALPPPERFSRLAWAAAVAWLAIGLLALVPSAARLARASRELKTFRAHEAAVHDALAQPAGTDELAWSVAHTGDGRTCAIRLTRPCNAHIVCNDGEVLYQGAGTCGDGRYVDPADSWLDGTPICVIDFARKRALVRDVKCHRDSHEDFYDDKWRVDLELP